MADFAVNILLKTLREMIGMHRDLLSGCTRELHELKQDLEDFEAFLQRSACSREKREALTPFEREIRDLAYQIEDTIDDYFVLAVAEKSYCFSLPNMHIKRLNVVKTLRALRENELRSVINRAEKAAADASVTSAQVPKIEHQKIPLMKEINVVGFEDELGTLVGYLNEESEELDVIPIVGMGGSGKTTLANMVYGDHRIKYTFPTLFWVTVSQEFSMKNLLLTIRKEFNQKDVSQLTDSMLADIVRLSLDKAKFLIVLDDVHTIKDWRAIEVALPKTNRFGKVLVTTHDEEVACQANPKKYPHRLRSLNLDESWELLQVEVFGKLEECPPHLEMIGKDIANKCKGVPLAIRLMGGILRESLSTSHVRDDWEKILMKVNMYLSNDTAKRMENIIALSYNKLPHDLKVGFLYFGIFPEDTGISAQKLIRLWIAEGFIPLNSRKSLEEVAEDYLKDLVDRSLVMVHKAKMEGGIKTCRISNMIREFCISEAASENLFQVVKRSGEGIFHPPVSEIQKCRRLCINSGVVNFLCQKPNVPMVRSLLCFSKESENLSAECTESILEGFSSLRALDVNLIKFRKFPRNLPKLVHLRYLTLSSEKLNSVPKSVSKLWNLKTLIIYTKSPTFEIKANVWKMMHLRHLKTKAAIVINTEAKGKAGESLQALSRLATQCVTEDFCNRASNLKKLGIRGKLGNLLEVKCLTKLDRLQKLNLVHDVYPNMTSEHPLISLPYPEAFPPNLRILKLSYTFLEWKQMSTLGMLHTLEVLKLKENAFMGKCWEADGGGFPYLEFLLIEDTDVKVWTAKGDPFPKLRRLVLKNCMRLEEIPHVLVKSLQVIDIECCTKSLVDSTKRIEEEKQQMQGRPRDKRGGFKLTISPGDEQQSLDRDAQVLL